MVVRHTHRGKDMLGETGSRTKAAQAIFAFRAGGKRNNSRRERLNVVSYQLFGEEEGRRRDQCT